MKTQKTIASLSDYMYPKLRKNWKAKRPSDPKELIEGAIAKDDPERIPDMYDEDMALKYEAERWDR